MVARTNTECGYQKSSEIKTIDNINGAAPYIYKEISILNISMALDYLSFGDIPLIHYHKVIKIWTPLLHCWHLLDFVKPPSQEHSELSINPPSIPYKKSKFCDFIFSSPPVVISAYKVQQKIIPTSDYSLI